MIILAVYWTLRSYDSQRAKNWNSTKLLFLGNYGNYPQVKFFASDVKKEIFSPFIDSIVPSLFRHNHLFNFWTCLVKFMEYVDCLFLQEKSQLSGIRSTKSYGRIIRVEVGLKTYHGYIFHFDIINQAETLLFSFFENII